MKNIFYTVLVFALIIGAACIGARISQMRENDYNSIHNVVVMERQTRIRHAYDELADCYWPDATVATSWTRGTIADFLAGNNNRTEASDDEVIVGRNGAPVIHINGNRAWVELPTTAQHWIHVNGERAIWTSHMRLIYRVEKRDGKWKIADMTSVFEKDMLSPVIPGTDLHINPMDLSGLRPSYMWMAYVRKATGGNVDDNLIGTDRPADIERLYRETLAWVTGK